jgi:predicted nucleotidyltransferase
MNKVARLLKRLLPPGYEAVLFGSRAVGNAHRGSDWDIGLLGPEPLRGAVIQTIRFALEDLPTLQTFDVVDLATTSREFREKVLKKSVKLV